MNKMDEQQIPNLEAMDEQEARHFLTELFSHLSAEAEYGLRHQDYAMEMPQSGERIRGPENMRTFQQAFADNSNPPSIQIRPWGTCCWRRCSHWSCIKRSAGQLGSRRWRRPWARSAPR